VGCRYETQMYTYFISHWGIDYTVPAVCKNDAIEQSEQQTALMIAVNFTV